MHEFKAGDVVRLKSGGPRMTVYDVSEHNALCCWFSGAHELSYGAFTPLVLEAAPSNELERTVQLAQAMQRVRERGEQEARKKPSP